MYDVTDALSRRRVLKRGAIATGVLALGGTTATGTVAAGIGEGRVLDYHLNNLNYDRERGEVVAGHVHDASPSDNHGEWTQYENDPVVKDAPVGNAFEFDGSADYVDIAASPSLEAEAVTVAAWINPDESAFNYIVDGPGHNYYLKLDDKSTSPEFGFFNDGGFHRLVGPELTPGTWTHVAATYDAESTMRIYIEGAQVSSESASGPIWQYSSDNYKYDSDEARVGRYLGSGPGDGYYFDGRLDEVRVYDRALSETEVEELATMDES